MTNTQTVPLLLYADIAQHYTCRNIRGEISVAEYERFFRLPSLDTLQQLCSKVQHTHLLQNDETKTTYQGGH